MAKGIGNGFPLAAVVTTPEIAKQMGTALHFNTYGGNPMASAVGSAVLDVSIGEFRDCWCFCKAKLYPGEIWSGGKNVTVVVVIFLSGGKYFPGIFFPLPWNSIWVVID